MQGRPSSLDHPLRDPVRLELRLLVVGGEFRAGVLVGLVDDLAVGVAEDAAGRDVDDPRRLRLERRLEDPFGPGDVRLVHRRVLGGRDPDLVHRGGVDRRVAALEAGADRRAVGEVAGDELAADRREPLALLRVADQADDLVAAVAQLPHDLAADEAGASGNEDLHGTNPSAPRGAKRQRSSLHAPRSQPKPIRAMDRAERSRPDQPARAPAGARDRHRRRRGGRRRPPRGAEGAAADGRRRDRRRDGPAPRPARPRPLLRQGQDGRAEGGDRRDRAPTSSPATTSSRRARSAASRRPSTCR